MSVDLPLRSAWPCALVLALAPSLAAAQAPPAVPAQPLDDIVVTATRSPLAASRSGGAISIVSHEEIENFGAKSFADALRSVPGLDIRESGGPAGISNITLRGSSPGQTLVMIDGIRIGDPSSIAGEADVGGLLPTDIERIEVLRGPQSALYGSDAMGGVVNIITRKGQRDPKASIAVEGGSYGSLATRAALSGATETLSYAFSLDGFRTDGYSSYGYRIGRIASARTTPLERDLTQKGAGSARIAWRPVEGVELEVGVQSFASFFHFDNPGAFGTDPDDRFNKTRTRFTQAYARANVDSFGGLLRNHLTVFGNETDRVNRLTQSCFDSFFNSFDCNTFYRGQRFGVEYQGDLRLGSFGLLIFGARSEYETARTQEQNFPTPAPKVVKFDKDQTTNSAFVLHQITLGDRLDLSLGGRIDAIEGGKTFATGRATAAFRIPETGTKLRASVGTGAKAASLYQRFSIYGDPNLAPEYNDGADAGVDQDLFGGRAKLSATAYYTRYRNLIDFDPVKNFGVGGYVNIGRAETSGFEFAADAILLPDQWKARASFTVQEARDLGRHQELLRRPRQKAYVSLTYVGIPNLEIEARAYAVGRRIDVDNATFQRVVMPSYARLDLRAEYRFTQALSAYVRAENVTNARYEEIRDYGTAGRAFYAGLKATW